MKSKPVHHQEVFVMSGELDFISYLVKIRIWEIMIFYFNTVFIGNIIRKTIYCDLLFGELDMRCGH